MRHIAVLLLSLTALIGCTQDPWVPVMTNKLDSMITLSKSHESVIASIDKDRVATAFEVLGAYEVFFNENLDEMQRLEVDKSMYTGPLYRMTNCVKYLGRVDGSFSAEVDPLKNTVQLEHLLADVRSSILDSADAVNYFNQEATILRSTDRIINKSYGGCFTCLREYDSLVVVLDSLKGFILAPHAQL